jgi:hypothetical protein
MGQSGQLSGFLPRSRFGPPKPDPSFQVARGVLALGRPGVVVTGELPGDVDDRQVPIRGAKNVLRDGIRRFLYGVADLA